MSSNAPARLERRGFLRNLASLPLIGGGITLIGSPTRAAEPITRELLDSYDAWLFHERRYLRYERHGVNDPDDSWDREWVLVHRSSVKDGCRGWDTVSTDNGGGRFHGTPDPRSAPQPSSRAAVVLAAAGCNWREG